jgi:hypothetical protein
VTTTSTIIFALGVAITTTTKVTQKSHTNSSKKTL